MNDDDPTVPDSNASEDTDDSDSLRPNRWQGAPSTWTTLTAQERGLAASLDQIRNADLSIHLYNAHALKRRAREYEEDPEVCTYQFRELSKIMLNVGYLESEKRPPRSPR